MVVRFDKDLAEILEVEEKASISESYRFFWSSGVLAYIEQLANVTHFTFSPLIQGVNLERAERERVAHYIHTPGFKAEI